MPRSARKEQARARAAGSKGAAAEGDRAQAADGATQGRRPGRDQGTVSANFCQHIFAQTPVWANMSGQNSA